MAQINRPAFQNDCSLVVQVIYNGAWEDYASIKTSGDHIYACQLIEKHPESYRIVSLFMGKHVVYP